MLNQKKLLDLVKGDSVDHFLLVRACEIKTTRANKPYLFLELGDQSQNLNANVWDNFESIYSDIKCGDVVKVKGTIDTYQNSNQIKVEEIQPVKNNEISPKNFLPTTKKDLEKMKNDFLNRINAISDVYLKKLLLAVFEGENFNKFSSAPAGKFWHHGYIGGLLEHTLEIIKICDLMCDIHQQINRDLLIAGAMLHDFGKTEELKFDSSFEYTDKGKLLGHIVICAMMIEEKAKNIPNFPEELKNCLIHLVLSHQGKLEYASPVVPKTLEAIVLYNADELSAKTNAYKNALESSNFDDSKWTKFINLASTDLFNHGIKPFTEEDKNTLFD